MVEWRRAQQKGSVGVSKLLAQREYQNTMVRVWLKYLRSFEPDCEMPPRCYNCDESFATVGELTRHEEATHPGEFKCSCKRTYRNSGVLRSHARRKHHAIRFYRSFRTADQGYQKREMILTPPMIHVGPSLLDMWATRQQRFGSVRIETPRRSQSCPSRTRLMDARADRSRSPRANRS